MAQAKADIEAITSNTSEWGALLTFTDPNGNTASINGLFIRHHMSINEDGMQVIGRNAHISFSEDLLSDEGYTVRVNNEVSLIDHKVTVTDSNQERTYKIKLVQPDETIGLIVCILGDYASA